MENNFSQKNYDKSRDAASRIDPSFTFFVGTHADDKNYPHNFPTKLGWQLQQQQIIQKRIVGGGRIDRFFVYRI